MHRRRKLLAAVTRAVAAVLTLSVAGAGMAAAAQAGDRASAAPSALRQSIDRAVEAAGTAPQAGVARAALSDDERADVSRRARRLQADPVAGQASGGGKVKTIVTVLSIAASVWATWYTIEWMKKQQERQQP